MARKKKSKRFSVALVASLLFHFLLASFLIYKITSPPISKRGVIAVEFIESVRHEKVAPRFRERVPPRIRPKNDAESTAAPSASLEDLNRAAQENESYNQQVLLLALAKKFYPRESVKRGEEGRVVIGVSVSRDGSVLEAHVEESSRFPRLDAAALKVVSEAAFPPLPDAMEAPKHLHIPFVFKLE